MQETSRGVCHKVTYHIYGGSTEAVNSPAMQFRMREAMNGDVDGIVDVVKTVYEEYQFAWDADGYHADLYDPETHYKSKGDQFLVAEDDRIVGVVGLCFHTLIPGDPGKVVTNEGRLRVAGTDCSLERLYVHPAARRRGLGQALAREVIARAKAAGCSGMELWSDKKLVDAHRLYGRFGAVTVGERLCHDPDQSPEWGLFLNLTQPLPT